MKGENNGLYNMGKKFKEKDIEDGIKKLNVVKVGDFEIHSTTAGLDKVVKDMKVLIRDYNDYSRLRLLDKVKSGVAGIG